MNENEDYIILPSGLLVFTAKYLKNRGFCCGNGCLNCPFDYENVTEPGRSKLLALRTQHEKQTNTKDLYEAIFDIVRQVPKGRVTTYGAVAAAIGAKSGARMVGYAMNHTNGLNPKVPAHRVVNSKGFLTGKHHFGSGDEMKILLEKEKVKVANDKVQRFDQLFWDPLIEITL